MYGCCGDRQVNCIAMTNQGRLASSCEANRRGPSASLAALGPGEVEHCNKIIIEWEASQSKGMVHII